MKKILSVIFTFIILSFGQTVFAQDEPKPLQSFIDETEAGEVLKLPPGKYVGGVVIDKPITIIGEDEVEIIDASQEPVITITTNNVIIKQLSITDQRQHPSVETIYVTGNDNELHHLNIKTNGIGIQLNDSHQNTLSNLNITGNKNASFGKRGNGIDLWESHHNTIKSTTLAHVQDGIYLENSKNNSITDNKVTESRYGYHLMFTEQNELHNNHSYFNVSGMMVMGTEGTIVKNNYLQHNKKSVQSLGLLLFDVKDALIANNLILDNRIGLFIESSEGNEITLNELKRNFIGIQFLKATDNHVFENALVANVVQGQAERSSNNNTDSNYWEDHVGLDTNGDGVSNLTYKVDPFYLSLTEEYPPFQIFFQAPGMDFLEQLLHAPTDQWLTDKSPLMVHPLQTETKGNTYSIYVFLLSIFFLIVSTTIIYMGVKKQ